MCVDIFGAAVYLWRKKSEPDFPNGEATERIQGLEASLNGALEKCAAERQGRIRAQKVSLFLPSLGFTNINLSFGVRNYGWTSLATVD